VLSHGSLSQLHEPLTYRVASAEGRSLTAVPSGASEYEALLEYRANFLPGNVYKCTLTVCRELRMLGRAHG
jgi:hypothetical protein